MSIPVIHAREEIPARTRGIFLAGPSAGPGGLSWRPSALDCLTHCTPAAQLGLTVLTPESRGGVRAAEYLDQFRWETFARERAAVILFWIPRDLKTMPGFTTNVEFGYDVAAGRRVVLGAPSDCPDPERNRYLIALANQHGVSVCETLHETVARAVDMARRVDAPN